MLAAGRGSMNSAIVFGASLWSGYALPGCHPKNGSTRPQPAEVPLIKRGNLSRQSRPPLRPIKCTISIAPSSMLEVVPTSILSSSQKGMRTHLQSLSRSRRDTPSKGQRRAYPARERLTALGESGDFAMVARNDDTPPRGPGERDANDRRTRNEGRRQRVPRRAGVIA
jgi:hypothetical protein